ncbi:MAG TPA: CHAD domain-containing protein [Caulobacteraceae bacterium]|nr:CHAD domain-containing protein [Caulobacteraceae bacterium]
METELKFEIDAGAVGALSERLALDVEGEAKSLRSVYFDTPKAALHAHGLVLRVRDDGDRHVQTVKKTRSNGFRRGEWEAEVEGPDPDLKAAAKTPLADELGRRKAAALRPAFETCVDRITRQIVVDGGVIEVALDRGVIEADDGATPILELELELKDGAPEALFDLARELCGLAPLNLSFASKAERGYALLDGGTLAPVKARDPMLRRGDDAGTAFKAIAGAALAQIADNARVLRRARRIEALHQTRVGARRLRSALSLFKPMLNDSRVDWVKTELKWLTHEMDEARNLDVFISDTFRPAVRRPADKTGLAPLGRKLIATQTAGYDRAVAAVESARFRNLVLEICAWIETGPWTSGDDPALTALRRRPIRAAAAEILEERRRKIAKRGRKLAELEPLARHKLRIQAKKLRYACGFFAGLYPGKAAGRLGAYVEVMEGLQDGLGATVDIVAAESLAVRLAGDAAPEVAYAAGLLAGRREAAAAGTLKAARKAFRRFEKAKPFW